MLRFDHMPSDFHPLFLFLGENADLDELARVLREFAEDPMDIDLRRSLPAAGGRSQVALVPGEGLDAPYGMRHTAEHDRFAWVLNAWQAGQIATRIEMLASTEAEAGNDILELGVADEIPVKVSKGEFTDNFLTPGHHLDPDYRTDAADPPGLPSGGDNSTPT
ncbi:hypothetical protein [Nocardia carnea]|uniref:hypothetical protein n=1 Tax=Nocardia carnea TaxID=37328 RepID=UPI0024540653|nr:hypothetical protein [Nocardia carnea]